MPAGWPEIVVHHWPIVQGLILLLVANGAPILAKRFLGPYGAWPLDGGLVLADGQPLFGRSKTVRGVLLGIVVTAAIAPLVGLAWTVGALAGAAAMAGDLVSSFVKRRLHRPPSSMARGLDQIPESLLPLLACKSALGLSAFDIVVGTAAFWLGELVLSRALFALRIRDQPY